MMLQKSIVFIAVLFLVSCHPMTPKEEKQTKPAEAEKPAEVKKPVYGKKFFTYDEILHYVDANGQGELSSLMDKVHLTADESLKFDLLAGDTPKNISDTSFIRKLEKIGYTKRNVGKEKFAVIDSIFTEKTVSESWATACMINYRNILLFKRKHKTIGIARICFGCGKHQIIGTTANTKNFGFDGDFAKLDRLLKN